MHAWLQIATEAPDRYQTSLSQYIKKDTVRNRLKISIFCTVNVGIFVLMSVPWCCYSVYSPEIQEFIFSSCIQQSWKFTSSFLLHATLVVYTEAHIEMDQGRSEYAPVIPLFSVPFSFHLLYYWEHYLQCPNSAVISFTKTSTQLDCIALLCENLLTPQKALCCAIRPCCALGLHQVTVISLFQAIIIIQHRY